MSVSNKTKREHKKQVLYRSERYENLNIKMLCPICHIFSNLNIIKMHFKTKKCQAIKRLLSDGEKVFIERKINKLCKLAQLEDITDDDLKKVMNDKFDDNTR